MAPTTSRPCATACLQVLPTTESQHARCLLLFDDRTFVGDVRSSEMCHFFLRTARSYNFRQALGKILAMAVQTPAAPIR